MSLFRQAAQANNVGITALLGGKESLAIRAIMNSLKLLKEELVRNETAGYFAPATTSRLDEIKRVAIPASLAQLSSETIIFDQAFLLPVSRQQQEDTREHASDFELNMFTSAVLFNLAVAHQTVGGSKFLDNAEILYGMTLKLLDNSAFYSVTAALLVKLGCINNLSQLQYLIGDF